MNPLNENQDTAQTSAYNPFPEPQTIPAGWDTSEFFSVNLPVSTEQVDEPVESKDH